MAGLTVAKVFLFIAPVMWLWDRWMREGESPLAVLEWVEVRGFPDLLKELYRLRGAVMISAVLWEV